MAEPNAQAWLTSALNNEDVLNALTLACSLRRASSGIKVGVIVSPILSFQMKKALHNGFNSVFYLENDFNVAGLKQEDFVKIYSLALTCFSKCVYLSPNMMVCLLLKLLKMLKNCDELFHVPDSLECRKVDGMTCFGVWPSFERFDQLMDSFHKKQVVGVDSLDVERFLRTWASAETNSIQFLNTKYICDILSQTGVPIWNASIVNLANISFGMDLENNGLCDKLILKYRKMIIDEDVQQLLNLPEIKSALTKPLRQHRDSIKEPIAIIGMSCRFPNAPNVENFWELLVSSSDGVTIPPDYRWTTNLVGRTNAYYRQTKAGFLNYPVEDFDAKFFNISPKEMLFLDPQQRLLHELVWEGLEDSGVNPQSLRGTNGSVFLGAWTNEYKEILAQGGRTDDEYYRTYMGNSFGAAAARLSFLLGMTGPSIATESGCSSAMVAVHLACKSLQQRETNLSLACGVNLLLHPFDKELIPMVLSATGVCKTWDATADGFVRAEGAGVLVLKRVSDAVRDGDNILGLIRGSAISQEGTTKSMGTPTVHSESLAMSLALEDASVLPEQVSFVEAHGTGTLVGDPLEIEAITKAYHSPNRKEPLLIGSAKTNVGHTESCSGITGIMKVVLALQQELIPPHINFETLNPAIDLDAIPARIPLEPVKWLKQKGITRLAGVSSFGITGTDAHVILGESPTQPTSFYAQINEWERPLHPMKISAKTNVALDTLLENYKIHLLTTTENIKDMAHSANVGRADFGYRAVLVASSAEDAVMQLENKGFRRGEPSSEESLGKLCFLFTGQGSQYPGMAQQLFETNPVFRFHFEYCAKVLKKKYNIDVIDALWVRKAGEEVKKTIYSQTSIFCVELALLRLWESWGVKPDYVVGHSLGEFAAAVCVGILSVDDALKLVAERSKLIEQLPSGKMLVVKASLGRVKNMMKKFPQPELDIAAVNSDEQTVVAGCTEMVVKFSEFCTKSGLKCVLLEATHAFHSKHMDPMLNQYQNVAASIKHSETGGGKHPIFISGLLGSVIEPCDVDSVYWVRHTREKVEFLGASKKAVELGCRTFIEIGPQPVLSALTMMNSDMSLLCLPSLKKTEGEWETLLSSVAQLYIKGMKINWKGIDQVYKRKKVKLPFYPFDRKPYWAKKLGTSTLSLHPLLGRLISNASPSKLFEAGLCPRKAEYLRDHVIGKNIIVPATAYLEICLAAGLATIQGSTDFLAPPNLPMMLEDTIIKAPLSLHESEPRQIQTVAQLSDSSGLGKVKVDIFQKETGTTGWIHHATSTFIPFVSEFYNENEIPFNANGFVETLKLPACSQHDILGIYENAVTAGLNFGPAFRSIEKFWKVSWANDSLITKIKSPTTKNPSSYILHPVVMDAMLQSIVMLQSSLYKPKKLYVPIQIGRLVWLSPVDFTKALYVYAFSSPKDGCGTALLVDGSGGQLALVSSVELIETTVRGIDSFLDQQNITLPEMWEEVWKPRQTPAQFPKETWKASGKVFSIEFEQKMELINENPPTQLLKTLDKIDKFIYYNILGVLYELGWAPQELSVFEQNALTQQLRVKESLGLYLGFFLGVLETEGILRKMKNEGTHSSQTISSWKVVKIPPSQEAVKNILDSSQFADLPSRFHATLLMVKLSHELPSIMKGEQEPLGVLFPPQNSGYPSVGEFYTEYSELINAMEFAASITNSWVSHVKEKTVDNNPIMRILEVGAGTGFFSSLMLSAFAEQNLKFEYTYTDISATFFPAAEKRFREEYGGSIHFKKLNIEEDPISQGFTPEYFDVVLASEVIHATRNIEESLQNMRVLMKPHAFLILVESTVLNRMFTFLFGPLESFWKFEDRKLRSTHCQLSKASWIQVLKKNGFQINGVFSRLKDAHTNFACEKTAHVVRSPSNVLSWLIFTFDSHPISEFLVEKLEQYRTLIVVVESVDDCNQEEDLGENKILVKIRKGNESDFQSLLKSLQTRGLTIEGVVYCWALDKNKTSQEELLQPYFHLVKAILTTMIGSFPRLYTLTNGIAPLDENDMSHCYSATLWGFTRVLKNENFGLTCKCIDIADDKCDQDRCGEIFHELWNREQDIIVGFKEKTRYVPMLQQHKPNKMALTLPNGSDRFQLILPESKAIADVEFGALAPFGELTENQVEIQVKATALNFRDVLSILKPTEQFRNINTVGSDVAGVVKRIGPKVKKWMVGDEVFGVATQLDTAMPSHLIVNEELVTRVPKHWTFCEAATIPTVYLTSIFCLLEEANIKKEDVVLIHTASGGVGLSAIQICRTVGCSIIATAGSKRKQNYLREMLGIEHIFHSRNIQYSAQILELTNGKGVDVVLNSLTSEGFKEATLKACGKGARFVEMSKLNIWTKSEVKELRPDVDYTIVDLSSDNVAKVQHILERLNELHLKDLIKPIPFVRFDALNIREALQYLQKAKHVGKVVCVMPELRNEGGELKVYTPMFNNKSTYLITGGLGGIGLVVCRWMLDKGAKHIVLASRSPPRSAIQRIISELNSKGANVISIKLDVGNLEQCREVIVKKIGCELPPLRGIMHAAGTLADALLEDLDWANFSSTFNAKINGSLNLHALTKHLQLEHFVMFSSLSALLGTVGQANHSAGNKFEDALTLYRHSVGLPATTINWGPWSEVGVATEIEIAGLSALSNALGIAGLEYVLKSGATQKAVFNVSSFSMISKVYPQISHYLGENMKVETSMTYNSVTLNPEKFWGEYDETPQLKDKIDLMKGWLRNIVRETLKHDENELIGDDADLQEMGVDSLMFVEIRNGLQTLFGNRFTVNAGLLKDCTTISTLSTLLVQLIEGVESIECDHRPTNEEVNALIRNDCQLSEALRPELGQNPVEIGETHTVLLTGCSGTLGPYILKELTNLSQITQVFCLMRSSKSGLLDEKLANILENKQLFSKIEMKKVSCVAGNVAEPHLGLDLGLWEALCAKVDAVFHVAVSSHHTERYTQRTRKNGCRPVNVDGTKTILEFAVTSRLKRVYHASSLLAVTTVNEDGKLSENWPAVGDYDNVTTLAYPNTKFVGDLLMKQGVERGIPVKVFRLPIIAGESQTGCCSIENNHLLLRYMFIMKNGIIPCNPIPIPMLPVDKCAEASVKLFFDERAQSDIYNILHRQPDADQEFVGVAKRFGYHVDVVDYQVFAERARSSSAGKKHSPFSIFEEMYQDDNEILQLYTSIPALKKWMQENQSKDQSTSSISRNVMKYLPSFYESQERTIEYIYRDLSFIKKQGGFQKFGLS